jgi:hypothetical protein
MLSPADLARRVHDLVREPKARELFQRHTKEYLAWRERKRGRTKKPKVMRVRCHVGQRGPDGMRERKKMFKFWASEIIQAPYLPFDRFDECGPAPDEPFPEVTLAEKYAVLAAHHDNHYGDDGPVLPRPDCGDRESLVWYLVLDYVRDHVHRHSQRVEDWYKDVLADLGAANAEPAPSTTTPAKAGDGAMGPANGTTKENKLTPTDRAAVNIIKQCSKNHGGISAKHLQTKLKKKGIDVELSTLTRHVLPKLKQHFNVANDRDGRGYYCRDAAT